MKNVELKIEGMSCSGCVAGVTRALKSVEGVSEATVSLEEGKAEVTFDEAKTSIPQLEQAVQEIGYGAKELSK